MARHTFKVIGWPDRFEVIAETRSKARYKLWLGYSDAYRCTFTEFLRICS